MFLDLTQLSTNFPLTPDGEIIRDNLVSLLKDMLGPERKAIVVQGPAGIGKTTLLSQFAKTFPDTTFSFFIGTTLVTSSPRYFLLDLCEQMSTVLHQDANKLDQLDTEELKQVFHDSIRKLARHARRTDQDFYFVVDGIELLPRDTDESSLINLLPAETLPHLHLLVTVESNRSFKFVHYNWDMLPFSLTETERFLGDLGLSTQDIQRIHKTSGGLPAYSAAIRRLLKSGMNFLEIANRLPDEVNGLFDLEWDRLGVVDQVSLKVLALLSYSKEALTVSALTEMTATTEDTLRGILSNISFISFDVASQSAVFVSEAHKKYAADRLQDARQTVEQTLIQYYSNHPYSSSSLMLLPSYLVMGDQYEQLKELLSLDYMSKALTSGRDIAILRRTLRLAGEKAFEREDWKSISKFTLSSSLLRTIAMRPVGEDEVKALIALGDYNKAFEIAYRALLPADRLQLLALICSDMQAKRYSIPENVLLEIRQMAESVDPANLRERALELSAVLFELLPEVAIRLVERAEGIAPGEKALDMARAMLALRLQTEATEKVKARIADPKLRDFARAYSPRTEALSAEEALFEAEKIRYTSGKLFFLSSWCNGNRQNSSAHVVISKAVEIITSDPSYAPSIRLLRQLSEPLVLAPVQEAATLIERLNLLKSTSIQQPIEEAIRFDLLIAQLQAKQSFEAGINHLLETYFGLDDIEELNTKCYCMTRIMAALPQIDPENTLQLPNELVEQFEIEIARLLDSSADQFALTRPIIRELATFDARRAIKLATSLNKPFRRDQALRALLWVYTGLPKEKVDFSIIREVLEKISDSERREVALVSSLDRLGNSGALSESNQARILFDQVDALNDPHNRAHAFAFIIRGLFARFNDSTLLETFQKLKQSLAGIDAEWRRTSIGFKLTTILASTCPSLAKSLLEETTAKRIDSFLGDEFFSRVYVDCLRLALRAFSGLVSSTNDYKTATRQLIDLIRLIPSVAVQCNLIADLALRHSLADKQADFETIVKDELLPLFTSSEYFEDRADTLIRISACLFKYDRHWTFQEISKMPRTKSDEALSLIVRHLITNSLPDDPIEMESLRSDVDARSARNICEVISHIQQDDEIAWAMDQLTDALIRPDPRDWKREVCFKLIERDALDVCTKLEDIVSANLPDPMGIAHSGYVVLCHSQINRLRAAAERRSANSQQIWERLVTQARAIPNIADRVYVITCMGELMFKSNPSMAYNLIQEAERQVPDIPNVLDRALRFYVIAKAWKKVQRTEGARMVLQTAMTVLRNHEWDQSRDEINELILKLAHSIDSEFASSLTPLMENPIEEHRAKLQLTSRELQKNPQRLQAVKKRGGDPDDMRELLGKAAWNLLESLNTGTTQARHPREIGQWLSEALDGRFSDVFPVMAWSIQNTLLHTNQPLAFSSAYQAVYDSLQLCREVSQILLGIRSQNTPTMTLTLPEDLLLFKAGQRSEALLVLHDWLKDKVQEYVKIYDPYFSTRDLEVLQYVPADAQVFVITSWKAQAGVTPGDRSIEHLYKSAWARISDVVPPWTQITLTGIDTSGDSPLHSRYLVTKGAGLNLGTSISGLGQKHSDLRILSSAEAAKIESELINPELVPQLRLFKGRRLIVYPFLL